MPPSPAEQPDPYLWLEDVYSPRSLDWVKAQNGRTTAILEADPRFAALEATALEVLESPDRLAMPRFRSGLIYNHWQDAQHVRGILRKTTLADYQSPTPTWHTVLDYDALAKQDDAQWVAKGLHCLYPGDSLCLVALSAGGEDAVTLREFDLRTETFVPNGFNLPTSKQDVTWLDPDTLLVARDWGLEAGHPTLTASGYPFIVKQWQRGQPLDQATELFRGTPTDVSAGVFTLHDENGEQGHQATLFYRSTSFFTRETYLLTPRGIERLAIPEKSNPAGLLHGQLLISIDEPWTPVNSDQTYPQGSILSLSLVAILEDPTHLKPLVVFTPTTQEFAEDVSLTRNHLLLTTLENVQGRAYRYTFTGNTWHPEKLPVPDNLSVAIVSTNTSDDQFFLQLTGYTTPTSLHLGDASTGALTLVKTRPPQFDASNLIVEQLQATSPDGTQIPYFVVRAKDIPYDGSSPILIDAYGGFQISNTPYYSGALGRLWLERGGIFVEANIRGGGEFGPAWHQAGLKTKRQLIYDDFTAVTRDLIVRRITSPRHLGIVGGSNGGLLMGVQMTQHPELYNAVVIQIPLLDMLRFEHIAAGPSWVGEYGSTSIPEERAFLASISPYNQLQPNTQYPEPLLFTTTKDDRTGPAHARKFAARLDEFHHPFFYQEIIEGGHGSGANLKQTANTQAVQYLYLTRKLMDK